MRLLQQGVFAPEDFLSSEENGCRLRPEKFPEYIQAYADYVHGADGEKREKAMADMTRRIAEAVKNRNPMDACGILEGWA